MSNIVDKKIGFATPFLTGYDKLKIPIIDSRGNSAWPDVFPINVIDEMRIVVGARHFASQMMLDFVPPDRVRLDPGQITFYDDEYDVARACIGQNHITGATMYWDPSMGRKTSDASVCVMLYRDDKHRFVFVHDVLYLSVDAGDEHPLARQCGRVIDFMSRHRVRKINIETNGIGNALPEIFRTTAHARDMGYVVCPITNNVRKETRIIDAIEPYLNTGRMFAHRRVCSTPLMSEMIGWSPIGGGGHDDGIDAVAGAICATPIPVYSSRGIQTYSANTNFQP